MAETSFHKMLFGNMKIYN